MLILSVKVPKRSHADGERYERIVLNFPDGSEGVVHFFHTSGQHMKVGFELPGAVGIRRGSSLDEVPPEKLAAFVDVLSKCADSIDSGRSR